MAEDHSTPYFQVGDVVQLKGAPRGSADTIFYYVAEQYHERVGKIVAIHEDNGGFDSRYQIEFHDGELHWFGIGQIDRKLDV